MSYYNDVHKINGDSLNEMDKIMSGEAARSIANNAINSIDNIIGRQRVQQAANIALSEERKKIFNREIELLKEGIKQRQALIDAMSALQESQKQMIELEERLDAAKDNPEEMMQIINEYYGQKESYEKNNTKSR